MELPHLGKNCAFRSCNRLDFLATKCEACLESFCWEHYTCTNHECPAPNNRDVRVPACPLCGVPVPGRHGESPDAAVGEHIDNQCMSDPAKERRKKVYTNRCSYKGCKTKEMIPVVCVECDLNFCLRHRHTTDHSCEGNLAADSLWRRLTPSSVYNSVYDSVDNFVRGAYGFRTSWRDVLEIMKILAVVLVALYVLHSGGAL